MEALASAARLFKGKITKLPIIGKKYENTGVSFELLQKDVSEYAVMNLDYGDDLINLFETMKDNKTSVHAIGSKPTWNNDNKDDYGKQQEYSKKLDMFLKREALYKRIKKKIYTIYYGQSTPSLLSGIKLANNFSQKDKEKDPIWIMELI